MFKIDYKIIYENGLASDIYYDFYPEVEDYFDAIDTVYGDILITVNNSHYGDISDTSFEPYYDGDDTCGDTVLDHWFKKLLDVCIELQSGKECRINERVCAEECLCLKKDKIGDFLVSYLSGGKVIWTEKISCNEFVEEVICKAGSFICDLCEYNERIAYSPVVSSIEYRLDKLKKEIY